MQWLARLSNAVGGLLFVSLFGVFVVQIGARFGFNQPLPWTDELAVVLYLWVIMWASAFMVPEREHVAFDLVLHAASARTQLVMRLLGHVLVGALALLSLPASWDYVRFMAREGTPVLELPFMWVFLPLVLLLASWTIRSMRGAVQVVREWRALRHGRAPGPGAAT